MFRSRSSAVIAIDTAGQEIHFYTKQRGAKNAFRHDVESYSANPFDEAFFEKLAHVLKFYKEANPTAGIDHPVLVLPDHVVCTDTVTIPFVQKAKVNSSVTLAINSVYKNSDQIKFTSYPIFQNKQNLTFGLVGMRRELISRLRRVFSENQISLECISFAANTAVNGAFAVNSKLKSGTFLLMDVMENATRFSFVLKGKTIAFYSLPFGYAVLNPMLVSSEEALFDHAAADLLVLNAKERARAKQLTVSPELLAQTDEVGNEPQSPFMGEDAAEEELEEDNAPVAENVAAAISVEVAKRAGRKLPKYLQRPVPETGEGAVLENFRIFVKWALDLIRANGALLSFGAPDTVYVNMPQEYGFLYDMVNAEREENGVAFAPLVTDAERHKTALENLSLYGALYCKQYNKLNNF